MFSVKVLGLSSDSARLSLSLVLLDFLDLSAFLLALRLLSVLRGDLLEFDSLKSGGGLNLSHGVFVIVDKAESLSSSSSEEFLNSEEADMLLLEMSSDVFSDLFLGDLGLVGVENVDDLNKVKTNLPFDTCSKVCYF